MNLVNGAPKLPALVELYTAYGRVLGVTRSVQGRRRLIDILNSTESFIELDQVKAHMDGGTVALGDHVTIAKQFILAAVPRETQQQVHDMEIHRNLMGPLARRRVPMTAILPTMSLEGTAHITGGAGTIKFDSSLFGQFFALTDVTLRAQDKETLAPMVAVNRDSVIAASFGLATPRQASTSAETNQATDDELVQDLRRI